MDITKLSAEQRLHRSHVAIMNHKKFILMSGILVSGKTEVVDSGIQTACTDGLNVLYNRNFVTTLPEKELNFVVLHENWHKAYKHTLVWRHLYEKNPKVANMACDYVINLQIVKYDPHGEIAVMPKHALYDPRFDGMDTLQVFNILLQENESGGDGGDGESNGEGDGSSTTGGHGGFDEHDWENAKSWDEETRKDVERKIDQALRQGEVLLKKKGEIGSGGDRAFSELLEPKINPYDLLREYMVSTCAERSESSWRRPNRRFVSQDIIMPSSVSEAMDSAVFALDMSGSIGEAEAREAITEFTNICKCVRPSKVHVIYWDTEVCRHEVYEQNEISEIVTRTKPTGGGGTDPYCVKSFLESNNVTAQVLVMLTDGYIGEVKGWVNIPTIWVVGSGGAKSLSVPGKVINL